MFKNFLKKMQRKKIMFLVLLITIIISNFFWHQPQFVLSAMHTWSQTNWSGQASTDTGIHPTNQAGWNKYSSKDANLIAVNSGADLQLAVIGPFRKPVTIINTGTSILTNYQVLITMDTVGLISTEKMKINCGDIRFTDSNKTTLINYWLESGCNSTSTKIWVTIPSIPVGNKTIYIYYGNLGIGNYSGDLTLGLSSGNPGNSCLHIKTNNSSAASGTYWIRPGGSTFQVYCDMTIDGGVWTKLNQNLATISVNKGTAFWSGDDIGGTGRGTSCNVNPRQYTLTNIGINYSKVYTLLQRTTSVLQCSDHLSYLDTSGWYTPPYNGSFTPYGMCVWREKIWANNCCSSFNMSGLKLNWVMKKSGENTALYYNTTCSADLDNGAFTMQWFVKKGDRLTTDPTTNIGAEENSFFIQILTSSAYNTYSTINVLNKIQWTENLPPGTTIKFQLRTAPNSEGVPGTWTSWIGPTGTSTSFFTDPAGSETMPSIFKDNLNDQWVQYKVWLEATIANTPTLSDVTLTYTIDTAPPSSTITPICSVVENKCVSTRLGASFQEPYDVDLITGTAEDNLSGIDKVEISIYNTLTEKYYDASTNAFDSNLEKWIISNLSIQEATTTAWSYNSSGIAWTINTNYQIRFKAIDLAQNNELPQSLNFRFINYSSPVNPGNGNPGTTPANPPDPSSTQCPVIANDADNLIFWGGKKRDTESVIGLGRQDPKVIVAKIIRAFLGFLGIIAIGFIIYAGYVYMINKGEEEQIDKAKTILKRAIIGLIIILTSFGVVNLILRLLSGATNSVC